MSRRSERTFFDIARAWASAALIAAGAVAIIGSTLDWVRITLRPQLRGDTSFQGETNRPEAPRVTRPFSGLEAGDGWWSLAGGAGLVVGGGMLFFRRRAGWAWLALLASIVTGAVGIANYRGIGNLSSAISHRMDIVGGARPALGLTLVVAGGIAGLVGAVAGIAASPREVVSTAS